MLEIAPEALHRFMQGWRVARDELARWESAWKSRHASGYITPLSRRNLDSEEAVAEYLTAVLAENDPALLAAALGDIARARGMSEIAKSSGLAREALYKALRPGAQPRFDTVSRVCAALGVRLVAQPVA